MTLPFQLVFQANKDSLSRILSAQHVKQIFAHKYSRILGGKIIELVINSPGIVLQPTAADDTSRVLIKGRVFYHSRRESNRDDLGTGAVFDATLTAKLGLTNGNPGLYYPAAALTVSSGETSPNDIVVHVAAPQLQQEVKDSIMVFLPDFDGVFSIPLIRFAGVDVVYLGFRFVDAGPRGTCLSIGMNPGPGAALWDPTQGLDIALPILQRDWAIGFSAWYVKSWIASGMWQAFGNSLPPPFGQSPLLLDERCTVRTFWGSCWNYQRTYLQRLDFSLEPNAIVFSGSIFIHNTGALIPDVNADFSVSVTLSIGANQTLAFSVGEPIVSAGLIDSLVNNAMKNAIGNAIRTALQSGLSGTTFTVTLPEAVEQFASVGSTATIAVEPTAKTVNVGPSGIIVHGDLMVRDTDEPPLATFVSIPTSDPLRYIYDAGDSWAPGGRIVKYEWRFPLRTLVSRDENARFVIEYTYTTGEIASGGIFPCLIVTDDKGRTSSTCGPPPVQPVVTLVPVPTFQGQLTPWEIAPTQSGYPIQFLAHAGGIPLPEVLVRLAGADWEHEGYTESTGRVTLVCEADRSLQLGDSGVPPRLFARGFVRVEGSRDGFAPFASRIWVIDTTARLAFLERQRKNLDTLRRRLQNLETVQAFPADIRGVAVFDSIATIRAISETVDKFLNQIAKGAPVDDLVSFLGFSPDPARLESQIEERFRKVVSDLDKLATDLHSQVRQNRE